MFGLHIFSVCSRHGFDYLFTKMSNYVLQIGKINLNCKIANSSMDWNFIAQLLILVI